MLNCEELLEKLNANPDIEPWFKETLSALIPKGFEAIVKMIGEKRTQEILQRTAWIVENSTMSFDNLNKDIKKKASNENGEKGSAENSIKYSTGGTWNGGFIKQDGKMFFTGALKNKEGLPNFVGELKIDVNSETKVQHLIHEFFGHLIVQNIEPQKIGDKYYAIDGFYMEELSEKGERTRIKNRLVAEGFAELVSEKVAKECDIPYIISSLYSNGCRAAKMLCQTTNNKALEHNFSGTPYVLQQDMDKLIGDNSWEDIVMSLDFDFHCKMNLPNDYTPKHYLCNAQNTLSSFFVEASNLSNLSISELSTKIRNFEMTSFFEDYKIEPGLKDVFTTQYIKSNFRNDYSKNELVKHTVAFNNTFNSIYDNQSQFDEEIYMLLADILNNKMPREEVIKSRLKIYANKNEKDNNALNTSVSFSEDIFNKPFNESIMLLESSNETKLSFLKFNSDDSYRSYKDNIYACSQINLCELTQLQSSEKLDPHDKFITQKLYEEYSKHSKVKKFLKTKTDNIKKSDIPKSYIFEPVNSKSIYVISEINENEYDIHHMERFSKESFRKLNMSQPQKVGENARKRDLSFMCSNPKEGASQQSKTHSQQNPTKSIHDFVSKETTAQH